MSRPKRRPGRPPKPEKEKVGEMLALRMSREEKEALDEIVRKRAARLAHEGGAVTASSVIRGLIRQAAQAEGIELGGEDAVQRGRKAKA